MASKNRVVLCFIIFFVSAVDAGILFYKERVAVKILPPDTIEVTGIYYFKNDDPQTANTSIVYPFPTDSCLSQAFHIKVNSISSGEEIKFISRKSEIEWNYSLPASSHDSIKVIYRQLSNNFTGRYIVTTTRLWDSPLESAEFSFMCPQPADLDYISVPADSVFSRNDTLVYKAGFARFWPEQDLLFSWKIPAQSTKRKTVKSGRPISDIGHK